MVLIRVRLGLVAERQGKPDLQGGIDRRRPVERFRDGPCLGEPRSCINCRARVALNVSRGNQSFDGLERVKAAVSMRRVQFPADTQRLVVRQPVGHTAPIDVLLAEIVEEIAQVNFVLIYTYIVIMAT